MEIAKYKRCVVVNNQAMVASIASNQRLLCLIDLFRYTKLQLYNKTLYYWSLGKLLDFSLKSQYFPPSGLRKHEDSQGNKTNIFPWNQ